MTVQMKKDVLQFGQVVIGNILFSLGVYWFLTPCGINSGGIVGIAQILDYVLRPLNPLAEVLDMTGIFNILLNIPLYIFALKISRPFFIKTFTGTLIQMLIFSLLPICKTTIMPDMLSNCIFGAILCGIGIGMTLHASACAGGLDILGAYFARVKPNFSVGQLSMALNACIFAVCAMLFNLQSALYSIIYVLICYFICDKFHYQNINISAMIFTRDVDLKNKIMNETKRGVTYWNGKGAYTDQDQYILVCALSKYEVRLFQKIIQKEDPHAFMILSEGQAISGGFEKRL